MYQKRNKLNILQLYLKDYNNQYYLREISKLTKIPLKTTQNLISDLEKDKIITSIISGKNKYFKLNLDNIQTKFLLLQAEIQKTQIFLNKYPIFKTFLKDIKKNTPIIIFGSFAKLSATKDSDLDILILSKEKLSLHLLPYKTHKIILTIPTFIKSIEKKETLIKEIQENHIILNNHSFYINIMWGYYGK